jgi:hypothetical protein
MTLTRRGQTRGGKIAPQPPTHVSFDAARSNGLKNSEMKSAEEGLAANKLARRAACLTPIWRLRIVDMRRRAQIPRPPRREGADPTCRGDIRQWTFYVQERSEGMLPLKGETAAA